MPSQSEIAIASAEQEVRVARERYTRASNRLIQYREDIRRREYLTRILSELDIGDYHLIAFSLEDWQDGNTLAIPNEALKPAITKLLQNIERDIARFETIHPHLVA